MPCQSDEDFAQGSEMSNIVTPTKLQRNLRASHHNPEAEKLECQCDSYRPSPKKKEDKEAGAAPVCVCRY